MKQEFLNIKKFSLFFLGLCLNLSLLWTCSKSPIQVEEEPKPDKPQPEVIGSIPNTVLPDVAITQQATKIAQLTGDYDKHLNVPVLSQTQTRYKIDGIDLGVPFEDGETTWILFGDTWGSKGGLRDAVAYTTDKTPEDGLKIDFIADADGVYNPIHIPGISQGGFEVPNEGIVLNNEFFVWHTTDHKPGVITMGRNVLAHAIRDNAEKGKYEFLYNYSTSKFINVSVVKVANSQWSDLPEKEGDGLIIFGSGTYRASLIYLAYQPASKIKNKSSIRYFAGMKDGKPLWNTKESDAQPIYNMSKPEVGELSASYNKFIRKWILMYNHGEPRGINLRTADSPWGPWSDTQVVFRPWEDGGYCHFIHTNWQHSKCDDVHNPGRENEWGGEYAPYQFEHFAIGDEQSTTIYFTLSTWNPYEVVLMKAGLKLKN